MISVGMLGGGRAAATYYLDRQANCAAAYYEGDRDLPGRWIGGGAAALGLTGEFGADGGRAFADLLDGILPDGRRAVRPVLRSDPRGRLNARLLLTAVEREAELQRRPAAALFSDERTVSTHARLVARAASQSRRGRDVSVSARTVTDLARAAGLDPARIYPGRGRGSYDAAVRWADAKVDVRRAGLDVVMSPPKSVSTLFALADPATADAVRQAHERAVDEAVGYLERTASHGLRGHQGDGRRADRVQTEGFVGAAFTHQTSRCDDPQLHTHVVIANVVRGVDGRLSSVDSRAVHKHAMTAGYLYQAVLRGELTRRLGVAWRAVERGVAEIEQVPASLLAEFSQRRAAIKEALDRTGGQSRAAAQAACYATRPEKSHVPRRIFVQSGAGGPRTSASTLTRWCSRRASEQVSRPHRASRCCEASCSAPKA